jgi:hypothetical protein
MIGWGMRFLRDDPGAAIQPITQILKRVALGPRRGAKYAHCRAPVAALFREDLFKHIDVQIISAI